METESTSHRLVADDLFAGAGGWDVAADWLDIHARGVENMPAARATRDAAGLTTIHDDVWTFKPSYRALTDAEVYAEQRAKGASHRVALIAAGLIASPPCQTFSQAGKGSGRKALDDVLAIIPDVPRLSLYVPPAMYETATAEQPALSFTHMAGAGKTAHQTADQIPRSVDAPAHTITGAGTAAWMNY